MSGKQQNQIEEDTERFRKYEGNAFVDANFILALFISQSEERANEKGARPDNLKPRSCGGVSVLASSILHQ